MTDFAKRLAKLDENIQNELVTRDPMMRLPHKGDRFVAIRDIPVEVGVYFHAPWIDEVLPMHVLDWTVPQGEVLRLDYEPVPSESTHCSLTPERYEELAAGLLQPDTVADKSYSHYSVSISYIQLHRGFEWLPCSEPSSATRQKEDGENMSGNPTEGLV